MRVDATDMHRAKTDDIESQAVDKSELMTGGGVQGMNT